MSVKPKYVHYPQTVLSSTALQCRRELYSPLGPTYASPEKVSIIIIFCQEGLILHNIYKTFPQKTSDKLLDVF